jgi:hypothetical protein
MRPTRLVPGFAIAALVVAGMAVPASAAARTISATPNKQLVDGQTISVSASGFAPDTEMAIVECPTAAVSPSVCDIDTLTFVTTDANGAYADVPFTVSRSLSDGTDCVTNHGCYVGTQDSGATGPTASTIIKFNPKIPPFVFTVRVDHTDKVNSKGVASITGTVHCENGAATVEVEVDLRQVVDRSIYVSSGFAEVPCAADTTAPFRATVRPQNGLFGPGAASVRVFGQAGSHFLTHKVGVQLVAK